MWAFHNQRSVSKSVFDKKAINICVVFDDGMGPPCLAWRCLGISEVTFAMQKVRLRVIEGRCVCSKKALRLFETGQLLGGAKKKNVLPDFCPPGKTMIFLQNVNRKIVAKPVAFVLVTAWCLLFCFQILMLKEGGWPGALRCCYGMKAQCVSFTAPCWIMSSTFHCKNCSITSE